MGDCTMHLVFPDGGLMLAFVLNELSRPCKKLMQVNVHEVIESHIGWSGAMLSSDFYE